MGDTPYLCRFGLALLAARRLNMERQSGDLLSFLQLLLVNLLLEHDLAQLLLPTPQLLPKNQVIPMSTFSI